jgi:hypothetical protein
MLNALVDSPLVSQDASIARSQIHRLPIQKHFHMMDN